MSVLDMQDIEVVKRAKALGAPCGKSEGGYRLYDKAAVGRIRFIKQAQHCGFTLAEILELLSLRRSASST